MTARSTAMLPAVVLFVLSGCAFIEQQATLRPQLTVAEGDVGRGTSIAVRIVDERPDRTLGHRGTAYGKGAKIMTTQDVARVVHDQITDGLKRKRFVPIDYEPGTARALKVEIRLLEYSTSAGFFSGGIHTKATLKAVATNGGKEYENFYRVDNEERIVIVPTAERNEELLNAALSEVLRQLFQDQQLLAFLAR